MNPINWQSFKCRASAISKMMSNKQGCAPITETQLARITELEARDKPMTDKMKLEYAELVEKRDKPPKIELSDTCIEYLMEVYAWETERMIPVNKESMDLAAIKKGKLMEQEAAALLCRVDKQLYYEHKEPIFNDYLCGEIDLYLGNSVYEATNVSDIKNAFDYPAFLKKINKGLENGQKEQLQGYGDITGAVELYVVNTLVNTPDDIILDYQYRLAKKLGCATTESPEFLAEWPKWERSMRFDHIAPQKRVHKIKVEPFTAIEKQKVYDKVKICRDWLCSFHEKYTQL